MEKGNLKMYKIFLLIMLISVLSFNTPMVKASSKINLSNSTSTNYYGVDITENEYINLISLGFSPDEIFYMTEETYERNKDLVGEVVSKNTTYYKMINSIFGSFIYEISSDDYNNQRLVEPMGTVSTNYMSLTTVITKIGNYFRYKVTSNWLNFPSVKNYDTIAIGMSSQVRINSDIYFTLSYCDTSSCYTSNSYSPKKTSTGGGASFKLPNITYTSLSSTAYFDVVKNTSGTVTSLSMCGAYAHSTTNLVNLNDAMNYSLSSSGILFNFGSIDKFNIVQCSTDTWSGSW